MAEIESPITSITGIGQRLGAIILAEIKNIHNFKTPSQLQAFAGLEPSIYQSGTMDVTGRMVKRSSCDQEINTYHLLPSQNELVF
ncbi:transposase [Lactococcus petauri]|jgi:transposase|nr:transposase [Lactococcus petauri]USI66615.1 IS110 family transposase [Lactococcus petauri]USI69060.1 IS110 family transposase [Lactococcus petauri]WJE13727.1 IS110 family transposase [Lactococcus petauri]